MPYELQCFNPHLYASPSECRLIPNQCIAPTARRTRCKWTISSEDLAEASQRKHQAKTLAEGPERDEVISEYILLHCCDKWHRAKLDADRTGCLEELVKTYGAKIGFAKVKSEFKRETASPEPMATIPRFEPQYHLKRESKNASTPERENGMKLRSGTRILDPSTNHNTFRRNKHYFAPYKTDPTDTVRSHLLQDIRHDWASHGTVYSFTWPQYPEFIKIGYSAWSAEERVRSWQVCNPGASLSHRATFDFPERIERLIHLQLAQHRHRIGVCNVCRRSHIEWFKAPAAAVNDVIDDWAELVRREPLYGPDRQLTAKWQRRIRKFKGDVTAKALLDLLDAEADAKRKDRARSANRDEKLCTETFETRKSEVQPDLEVAGQLAATAIRTLQHSDQIVSFIEEFMALLAQREDLKGGKVKPRIRIPVLSADLLRTESTLSPTIVSAA